jgi:hypothetical protein
MGAKVFDTGVDIKCSTARRNQEYGYTEACLRKRFGIIEKKGPN